MENPFEPNITLTIEEINPFTPTSLGEGGLNSGAKLKKYITTKEFKDKDERVKKHNVNAQRLYRQRNRRDYNEYMKQHWKANKKANNDHYQNWIQNQAVANKNYRLKKLIENPSEKTIANLLRKEFREITPKKVGRRKKGEKTYKEKEEDYITDVENIKRISKVLKSKYEKEYEEFLAENTTTPSGKKRNLSKEPVYVLGEYEYKQYDPTGLQIASKTRPTGVDTNTKLQHNLKELKDYYESVITNIRPETNIPEKWEKGKSRFYPEGLGEASKKGALLLPTNFKAKRDTHKDTVERVMKDFDVKKKTKPQGGDKSEKD